MHARRFNRAGLNRKNWLAGDTGAFLSKGCMGGWRCQMEYPTAGRNWDTGYLSASVTATQLTRATHYWRNVRLNFELTSSIRVMRMRTIVNRYG